MSLADENSDGLVDYAEFVPVALGVLEAIYAKRKFDATRDARVAEAEGTCYDWLPYFLLQRNHSTAAPFTLVTASSKAFLLHGMPKDELEDAIRKVFGRADADGSGMLSRTEFADALRGSGLGLTRREINVIMAEVGTGRS